jgi:hypothetical protein
VLVVADHDFTHLLGPESLREVGFLCVFSVICFLIALIRASLGAISRSRGCDER